MSKVTKKIKDMPIYKPNNGGYTDYGKKIENSFSELITPFVEKAIKAGVPKHELAHMMNISLNYIATLAALHIRSCE